MEISVLSGSDFDGIQQTGRSVFMRSSFRQKKQIQFFKALWLIVTGGAFVSLAGGALTLMYFWSIGGVPVGQASSAGALAKIVLPTALFIVAVFLTIWLAPTMMSSAFIDEKEFTQILRRLFTNPEPIPKPIDKSQQNTHDERESERPPAAHSAILRQPQWELVSDQSHAILTASQLSGEKASASINFQRIFAFALVTVGSGCVALTLIALGYGHDGTPKAWVICLGGPVVFTGLALTGLWELFNHRTDRKGGDAIGARSFRREKWKLIEWLAFGYVSAAVAIAPLLAMLLAFLRSDTLLEDGSTLTFMAGAIFVSLAIVFSYAASLAVLVQRTKGTPVQWGTVLAINAIALFSVVMTLGLTSRMLEAVMVMASVRVENAVVTLEPEGCELLGSMQAIGWGRAPGTETKTCTLYGVTIQSTLEPSMQIACWRGTLTAGRKKMESDASSTEGTHSPRFALNTNTHVSSPSLQEPSIDSMKVLGNRGAFYMPIKYVRSVWKTGGLETQKDQGSVCPLTINVESALTPTKAASVKEIGAH